MGYALATVNVTLEIESCCTCGTHFAMPDTLQRSAKRDPNIYFYCPQGHPQHYSEGEAGRLRKQLAAQVQEAGWGGGEAEHGRQAARALQAQQERDDQAARAEKLLRKLKRVDRGVCPDCNRTFTNLARHMCSEHGKGSVVAIGAKRLPK